MTETIQCPRCAEESEREVGSSGNCPYCGEYIPETPLDACRAVYEAL